MGCGGRESVGAQLMSQGGLNLVSDFQARKTTDVVAYGKTVWSWHPLLVSSCRWQNRFRPETISHQTGSDGDKTNSSPGRARHKP